MNDPWTIKRVLDWTTDDFSKRGIDSPRLEAELLLGHLLKVERLYLYTHFDRPLATQELTLFRQLVARRRNGECNAHIIGVKEFWSLEFYVTSDVLVPRPDTETLVQAAVEVCKEGGTVLDLCTGSGCVAVAIAQECANVVVHATDVSASALAVAKNNVIKHQLEERVQLFEGDLFAPLPKDQRYDVIVSNPPYVIESDLVSLSPEVQKEPRIALLGGGDDGLEITRRLLEAASSYLRPNGHLFIELDDTQTVYVAQQLGPKVFGETGRTIKDLSQNNRVVAFHFRESD